MENYLKRLYAEDSPEDMEISLHYLKKSGYTFNVKRIETEGKFRSELESGDWDIVLCDYALPQFSGSEALKIVASSGRKIPLIIVTGAIGGKFFRDLIIRFFNCRASLSLASCNVLASS